MILIGQKLFECKRTLAQILHFNVLPRILHRLLILFSGQRREEIGIAIPNIPNCGRNGSNGTSVEGHHTPALRTRRCVQFRHRVTRRRGTPTHRLVSKATPQWLQAVKGDK